VHIEVRPAGQGERSYEERQRRPDDKEAQESQRPIAVHALERLATSDRGIVMLRRQLKEQLQIVKDGGDPMNIIRDEAVNAHIPTHAWNTVLSPEQAANHQGEEA
jgi:hypothetical protein